MYYNHFAQSEDQFCTLEDELSAVYLWMQMENNIWIELVAHMLCLPLLFRTQIKTALVNLFPLLL